MGSGPGAVFAVQCCLGESVCLTPIKFVSLKGENAEVRLPVKGPNGGACKINV